MTNLLPSELETSFLFRSRAISIPGDLRPGWRIAIVLLLLRKCCRQNRSSFTRLHVLSWGVRTKSSRRVIEDLIKGQSKPDSVLIRIEPSLNRAVDYALGEGLLSRVNGDKIELTSSGIKVADEIDAYREVVVSEKEFMSLIGKGLTETLVNQIFGKGA